MDKLSESCSQWQKPLTPEEVRQLKKSPIQNLTKTLSDLVPPETLAVYVRLPAYCPSKERGLKNRTLHPNERRDWCYTGQVNSKGARHGLGVLVLPSRALFYGYFEENTPSGQGILIQPDQTVVIGEWQGSSVMGGGKLVDIPRRAAYIGDFNGWKPSGKGIEQVRGKQLYEGEFRNGMKHGQGHIRWERGSSYTGEFKANKRHGNGEYVWANGNKYIGEFHNDIFQGTGELQSVDGKVYRGNFRNGQQDGYGELLEPGSREYKGFWKNSKEDGFGIELLHGTEVKRGYWKGGVFVRSHHSLEEAALFSRPRSMHSQTHVSTHYSTVHTRTFNSETVNFLHSFSPETNKNSRGMHIILIALQEIGELALNSAYKSSLQQHQRLPPFLFEEDTETRLLVIRWQPVSQNEVYRGEVDSESQPHGRGIKISRGNIWIGHWHCSQLEGLGRVVTPSGNHYEGYWQQGLRHGFGVEVKKHSRYVGEWRDGLKHGHGTLTTDNGVYSGEWAQGKQHGYGVLKYADRTTYTGQFKRGCIHGHGELVTADGSRSAGYWRKGKLHKRDGDRINRKEI